MPKKGYHQTIKHKKNISFSVSGDKNVSKKPDVRKKLIKNHWTKTHSKKEVNKKLSESISKARKKEKEYKIKTIPFENLSLKIRTEILYKERGNKCEKCGYEYTDLKTGKGPFEIHHKDENKNNNKKENLQILCLNCHWKTPNWRFRGSKHTKESIIKSLETQRLNGRIKTHKYINEIK